jgi:hypothetical protein
VFGQIDPFAGDYTNVSPYMYCAGNPINAIDPDGRRVVFIAGKSQFTYRNGSLWTASGNRVSRFSERLMGQAVQRGVNAYRSIENSGDMVLMGKLRTLVNSSNPHYVETTINGKDPRSVVVGYKEGKTVSEVEAMRANGESVGSQTLLNFSQEAKDEFMKNQGIPNSDFSTAAHEMQHSHDNEIGNMFDNTPLPADQNNNPAEKRAVGNENRARRIEGLPNRDSYEVVPASNGYGVKRAGTTNAYEHERPDWAQ